MPHYRKKPVVIEAMQLQDNPIQHYTVISWMHKHQPGSMCGRVCTIHDDGTEDRGLLIKTLEGTMKASPGDYIIRGVSGEFYPCKPDIFHETYEKVEDPTND